MGGGSSNRGAPSLFFKGGGREKSPSRLEKERRPHSLSTTKKKNWLLASPLSEGERAIP